MTPGQVAATDAMIDMDTLGLAPTEVWTHRSKKSQDHEILHTRKDKLSAMNLDDYYDTYYLLAVYLGFLDHFFEEPVSE
jgi:hypothetical protein